MKRLGLLIAGGVVVVILIAFSLFFFLKGDSSPNLLETSTRVKTEEEWLPYSIDTKSQALPLSEYLFNRIEVAELEELSKPQGTKEEKILESLRAKMPKYPFAEVPLFKPAMVVTAAQTPVGDNLSISTLLYTSASTNETLDFYRKTLGKYTDFKEEVIETSTGKSYHISFVMDATSKITNSITVMEMPKTTGYTCAIQAFISIKGTGKVDKPVVIITTRPDGLPSNYPDSLIPILKKKEVVESSGDEESCSVQYYSLATFSETLQFYRQTFSDKPDFKEEKESNSESTLYCKALNWGISVRIMDNDGLAYIEINAYK